MGELGECGGVVLGELEGIGIGIVPFDASG